MALPDWLLFSAASSSPLVIAILFFVLRYPDKFFCLIDNIGARLAFVILLLSKRVWPSLTQWADKKRTAAEISSELNSRSLRINTENPDAFPYRLRVQWVSEGNVSTTLKEGEVVVCLRPSHDWQHNVLKAALYYVETGFFPRVKLLLDRPLHKSIDFIATKMLLDAPDTVRALELLHKLELPRLLQEDSAIRSLLAKLEATVEPGFFTRVFLRELSILSRGYVQSIRPEEDWLKDIRGFLDFLYTLSIREREEEVPLKYLGLSIRCGFLLVANMQRLKQEGLEPYVRRLKLHFREGCQRVYVCGRGEFVKYVRHVVKVASKQRIVSRTHAYTYRQRIPGKARPIPVILFVCEPGRRGKSRDEEELERKLGDLIPEIRRASVEYIAVDKSHNTIKVALSAPQSLFAHIIRCWAALPPEKRTACGFERLTFVHWTSDLRKLIINALMPLKKDQVVDVDIDPVGAKATVTVLNEEALRVGIGHEGVNVRLAEEISGLRIHLKVSDPEELVKQVLAKYVPPIRQGVVRVTAVAYRAGEMAKILLSDPQSNDREEVLRKCFGRGTRRRDTLRMLSRLIAVNRINVVVDTGDMRQTVSHALYPLRAREVLDCRWDESGRRCILWLKDEDSLFRAKGQDDINLHLAQELLNIKIELRTEKENEK